MRDLAQMLNIRVIGTFGLIILAKRMNNLTEQASLRAVDRLLQFGVYYDPQLIEKVKRILKRKE